MSNSNSDNLFRHNVQGQSSDTEVGRDTGVTNEPPKNVQVEAVSDCAAPSCSLSVGVSEPVCRMYPLAVFDKDENLITEIFESPTSKIDMFSAKWIMNSFLSQLWEKGYLKEELYVSAKLAASDGDK